MLPLSALLLLKESTPALTVVVPLKLLLADKTKVPAPVLTKFPVLLITPELVTAATVLETRNSPSPARLIPRFIAELDVPA